MEGFLPPPLDLKQLKFEFFWFSKMDISFQRSPDPLYCPRPAASETSRHFDRNSKSIVHMFSKMSSVKESFAIYIDSDIINTAETPSLAACIRYSTVYVPCVQIKVDTIVEYCKLHSRHCQNFSCECFVQLIIVDN